MPTVILAGCAILKNGKILLIRKKDRDFWELPGGRVGDKSPEDTAVAKTFEQTGVTPTIVQQFTILEFQKDESNIEANIYECDADPEVSLAPGENIAEVKWFDLAGVGKENVGDDVKHVLEEFHS